MVRRSLLHRIILTSTNTIQKIRRLHVEMQTNVHRTVNGWRTHTSTRTSSTLVPWGNKLQLDDGLIDNSESVSQERGAKGRHVRPCSNRILMHFLGQRHLFA